MATLTILEITDGTRAGTVNLLSEKLGFHLREGWEPAIPPFKGGGVFQSSSLAQGRRLVQAEFDNATELFPLSVNGRGQDGVIREAQKLLRLLQDAINYWLTEQGSPVYIRAKSPCETNTRYAHIHFYSIPNIDNPHAQPFFTARKIAAMDSLELSIERGHWLANPPGTGECVELTSTVDWAYDAQWESIDTEAGFYWSAIQLANDRIIVGTASEISYSDNNGSSWTDVALATGGNIYELIQLDTGRVLAVGSGDLVFRSDNNGTSFPSSTASLNDDGRAFAQNTVTGTVMLGGFTGFTRSTNRGQTFSSLATAVTLTGAISGMAYFDGKFYASDQINVWRSDDDGLTWSIDFTTGSGGSSGSRLLTLSDGTLMAAFFNLSGEPDIIKFYVRKPGEATSGSKLYSKWSLRSTYDPGNTSTSYLFGKLAHKDNIIYCPVFIGTRGAGDDQIIRSDNLGKNWIVERESATVDVYGMLIAADDSVYAGQTTTLLKKSSTTITLGKAADCDGEVYIGNKQNKANITHIKVLDASGPTYTDIFPISSFPQNLLPATPALNDILYVGSDTTNFADAGPFDSLVFDLVPITLTNTYTINAEYWNGAWTTLNLTDNTTSGTFRFSQAGVNSMHWEPPSDWTTTTIDGVTAYWVRFHLAALTGSITPPKQQNRDIYAINNSYVEVDDSNVEGDISALARTRLTIQSDPYQGPVTFFSNRVICGLRKVSRGADFQAYINLSDEQTIPGIVVTTSGTFTALNAAPTGRYIAFTSTSTTFTTAATVTFDKTIIRQFYGTFHLFLRGYQQAGSGDEISARAQITTGSGGVSLTTEQANFKQVTDSFELIDLGEISIPPTGLLKTSEVGDQATIIIQLKKTSTNRTIRLFDIILIPVDEWAGDFYDFANNSSSVIGMTGSDLDKNHLLDIDSITHPVIDIRALVREEDVDEGVSAIYNPIVNGEAIWQENTTQRLWILSAAYGTSDAWVSKPQVGWSVQSYKNERYLALRGDR